MCESFKGTLRYFKRQSTFESTFVIFTVEKMLFEIIVIVIGGIVYYKRPLPKKQEVYEINCLLNEFVKIDKAPNEIMYGRHNSKDITVYLSDLVNNNTIEFCVTSQIIPNFKSGDTLHIIWQG